MKPLAKTGRATSGSHAVLDIGSSKVACFIADIANTGEIRVTGVGHQLSRGVRGGTITDFAEAETSIIASVHAAEQMAGVRVENVMLSLSGGGLASRNVVVEMPLNGAQVTDRDLLDVLEQGQDSVKGGDSEILHSIPVAYSLDGAARVEDPRRLCGEKLTAELHLITAYANAIRNLTHCLGRCHLNVEEIVAASHASAFACLEEDEAQLGVTLIDMGGATTGVSVFVGGKNVYSDVIPVGGMHVTSDIARGLSTTISHAERLKTMHGSCIATASDDQVMVSVPLLGEDDELMEASVQPRSHLVGIIRPRMEEIFELIRARITESGMEAVASRRVVLTGGASQLIGARDLAARMLSRQVRLARPKPLAGLAEAVSGPAFAASLGMLHYIVKKPMEDRLLDHTRSGEGYVSKLKSALRWVKESF